MSSRLLALALFLCPAFAGADLYRWLDPETGSVKFSSYPPPWYGDAEKEKHAPKVEHIPERKPPPGAPQGAALDTLEQQRKRLILELAAPTGPKDLQAGGAALKKQLENFAAVNTELDRLDPAGADRRRAEAQPVMEKLVQGLSAQPKPAPAR